MEAYYTHLNSLVNKNKSEYAHLNNIDWLNPYLADVYQEQRQRLIENLAIPPLFKGTKPCYGALSNGCSLCGAGVWSCLFITNRCNASCFYCPAIQTTDETPSTQGRDFHTPEAYAEYVADMGFKGVSFSGGEPLLYFERTLAFLKAVHKTSPGVYLWMYTNGMLADVQKLEQLAKAGLNEIRFDIGATGYRLDKVLVAKGIVPAITIEIPAVPEEKDRIIGLLPAMAAAGVKHLNLHQLRLTPHNASKLLQRKYTYIPAERPLVLESELVALEILEAAQQLQLPLGINYCSFYFKHRFQKAGFRRLMAQRYAPEATLTENGYIREYNGSALIYKTPDLSSPSGMRIVFQETVPTELKRGIEHIFTYEPETIPEHPFLFRVWQFEYMEEGLRAY